MKRTVYFKPTVVVEIEDDKITDVKFGWIDSYSITVDDLDDVIAEREEDVPACDLMDAWLAERGWFNT